MAGAGCTVIASIHQPSSEVFEVFDQLMILSQGHAVYHGPAAAASVRSHPERKLNIPA